MKVRFGAPIRLDPDDASHRSHLREATDELMAEIATLCGQEYVDRYAKQPVKA